MVFGSTYDIFHTEGGRGINSFPSDLGGERRLKRGLVWLWPWGGNLGLNPRRPLDRAVRCLQSYQSCNSCYVFCLFYVMKLLLQLRREFSVKAYQFGT